MSGDLPLDPEDVNEIVAILDGTPYERLEVRTGRFTLKVARSGEGWTQQWVPADAPAEAAAAAPAIAAVPEQPEEQGPAVRAKLPGTFYRAPQPGAPPFVVEGDAVEPDTVVGIVETMKLMNPVHAGVSGRVEAILVENGCPVPAGGVLMRIGE